MSRLHEYEVKSKDVAIFHGHLFKPIPILYFYIVYFSLYLFSLSLPLIQLKQLEKTIN